MTAKHRRGKSNHKQEDGVFKNDAAESEVAAGGNNHALLLVFFLLVVIGGATGSWFCFQQHQTLTYLTDNLMGMRMKIVKLQSSHEEMRQSNSEPLVSESLETRLNALEDSYALAQKQVGMALATAEQLKTSELPTQVLSLHTEMRARLAEMQQASVSLEQLSQLQTALKGKSEEFDGVRVQVDGLAALSAKLSQKVEGLTGRVGEAESEMEERAAHVAALSAALDGQAAEVLGLKEQLDAYQAQLQASTLEMATVRELLESEQSQRLQQASVEEEQLSAAEGQTEEETAEEEEAAATEEEALPADVEEEELPADVEEEASNPEEEALPVDVEEEASSPEEEEEEADKGEEAAAQEEAPVEQEDSVTEEVEAVKEDEMEPVALSEETAEAEQIEEEEEEPEEENQEADEEDRHTAEEEEEEEEEMLSEGENGLGGEEVSEGEEDVAAEEEAEETDEEEEPLENDAFPEDEFISFSLSHTSLLQCLGASVSDLPHSTGTMQAFAPRSYLTPVRDEEAESQRKAKSRHARQTRRSTQGVTLTDLKEAQKTNSLSPPDRQTEEGGSLAERSRLRKGLTDDRRVKIGSTETTETMEISPKWSKMDEQGNIEPRLETLAESPIPELSYACMAASQGLLHCNNSFLAGERWWRDENQNPVEEEAALTFATAPRHCSDGDSPTDGKHLQLSSMCHVLSADGSEHDRLSRYDSSGESATDKPLGRTSSYTRRETRLAALSRQEQDSTPKDYKKMYAEALHENEKLKSRLHDSKYELVKIRSQLEKVTQRHERISERSTVLDSEKREKQALEKRVSNMEDDLKAFPALAQVQTLRRVNECLLAENRAMLRVLSRLSETASMPETEDL